MLSNLKILVVEDQPSNFIYLEEVLSMNGAKIIHAKNGMDAIQCFSQNSSIIDLVLMDIKLPGIDGFETTKRLLEIKKTPIVAQTAYAFDRDRNKAFKAGCIDYLSKPIKANDLVKVILKHAAKNSNDKQ
ncbi:MAG: response regulator [Marinilabiliales bacterium]|nr:MAG: response regulator [Marinilabiliales bacterium]